jgi:PAS domain S-box-containing protein
MATGNRESQKGNKSTPVRKPALNKSKTKKDNPHLSELRRKSESKLKEAFGEAAVVPDDQTSQLIHELKVHQIELEMQDEELRRAQIEFEESRRKYSDLYDFAPVGYFSLDGKGVIREVNLTCAQLLGFERELFKNKPFSAFIQTGDHKVFFAHLSVVLERRSKQTCELKIRRKDGTEFFAQLDSIAVEDSTGDSLIRTAVSDITERKQSEEEIERFASFPHFNPNPVLEVSAGGQILFFNKAARMTLKELEMDEDVRVFLPDDMDEIMKALERREERQFRRLVNIEDRIFGEVIYLIPEHKAVRLYAHDITKRKRAEEELHKLNKAYKALSDSSQATIRAEEEQKYLEEVCRIIIEDCGYSMVWIGFVEDDEAKSVRPVAHAGFEKGYLETLALTWVDTERGRGPTGTAIRTGKVAVCRNILTDPAFTPWREQAIQRGYASSIVFPLRSENKVFGAISIYSKEADPFCEAEVKLLTELADDLSYGIQALRTRFARMRAEEVYRQSQEQNEFLAGLIRAASQPLAVGYPGGHLGIVNKAFEELTGYTSDELQSIDWATALTPPEWREVERVKLAELHSTGQPIRYEKEYIRKDSTRVPIELLVHLVTDSDGSPRYYYAFVTDITERKNAEKTLQESEEKFRSTYEQAAIGIEHIDLQGRFIRGNGKLSSILGYSDEELRHLTFMQITHPDDFKIEQPLIEQLIAGQIPNYTIEKRYIHKDGHSIWVRITSSIARTTSPYRVSITEDVTERKKAEEELHMLTEELKRSNSDLQQFAYAASHDLQEPLRGIAGYTRLLEKRYKGKLDKKADEFMDYIIGDAKRMQDLIKDLLEYSQIETKLKVVKPANCSVILEEAFNNLRSIVKDTGTELTYDYLPIVMADASQLKRLFQNLIGNAIKFHSQENPRIHISAKQRGDVWVFSVKDNGIGFESGLAERIFGMFQRLHTRQDYPGTGIGLAICKKIVERHGGRIWAESRPGNGSTFYFTLPVSDKLASTVEH